MSSSIVQRLSCPACACVQDFTAWESLNVTENPDLAGPLLAGELFTLRCVHCAAATPVAYDTLYHDMTNRLMIWLIYDPAVAPDSPELAPLPELALPYRRRLVRSGEALLEKIRIFRDGHDDRLIELFKLALTGTLLADPAAQAGSLVYLATTPNDKVSFLLQAAGAERVVAVSHRTEFLPFHLQHQPALRQADGADGPRGDAQWLHIDQAYALAYLTSKK